MRDEAAGVLGDDGVVLADADAAGPAVDDPTADDGVVAVERHELGELLVHHGTLVGIRAGRFLDHLAAADDLDVRPLSGVDDINSVGNKPRRTVPVPTVE